MSEEKKGITVKVPADLHAEVSEYLKANNKTMTEFVVMALQDELHPKNQNMEEKDMGNMRTIAFQVPESLFQKLKEHLDRNGLKQKEFFLGLLEKELEREQTERQANLRENERVEEVVEEEGEEQNNGDSDGGSGDEEETEEEDEAEEEENGEEYVEEEGQGPVMCM